MDHSTSERRSDQWTHFSVFGVWGNIRDEEVTELEDLFRDIYRRDGQAHVLNIQRGSRKLKALRNNNLAAWHNTSRTSELRSSRR